MDSSHRAVVKIEEAEESDSSINVKVQQQKPPRVGWTSCDPTFVPGNVDEKPVVKKEVEDSDAPLNVKEQQKIIPRRWNSGGSRESLVELMENYLIDASNKSGPIKTEEVEELNKNRQEQPLLVVQQQRQLQQPRAAGGADREKEIKEESDHDESDQEPPILDYYEEDEKKITLHSPMGGMALDFVLCRGEERDGPVAEELMLHVDHLFRGCPRIKETFEKAMVVWGAPVGVKWWRMPWHDVEKCPLFMTRLNEFIDAYVDARQQRVARHVSEWFSTPDISLDQFRILHSLCVKRVIKGPDRKKAFSAFYAHQPASIDVQFILDKIELTNKDVFVHLSSGSGCTLRFIATHQIAKAYVGIETDDFTANLASRMQNEFERMKSWYGKKQLERTTLIHGDFTDMKHRKLITEEATVFFAHNIIGDPDLVARVKQMVPLMRDGTRIVCTKRINVANNRFIDMLIDCDGLPLEETRRFSVSRDISFQIYTVNHSKVE